MSFPESSVIRRVLMLLMFAFPAIVLNLALIYAGTLLLNDEHFGVFYFSITVINVLFAPSLVVNLFFSRTFVALASETGEKVALQAVHHFVRIVAGWGALLGFGIIAVLGLAGLVLGVNAPLLILLVAVIVYTSYVADTLRAAMQGLHRFFRLGVYNLLWMAARFVLGVTGLYATGSAWGGLAGIALSAPAVFIPFLRGLAKLGQAPVSRDQWALPALSAMVPFSLGYTLCVATAYADIGVAYLLLDKADLGAYSASSVLPKGIIILTMPVLQVAFPVMVGRRVSTHLDYTVVLKGVIVTIATVGVAMAAVFLSSDYTCGPTFGIRPCRNDLMTVMALAIPPLVIVRVLVMAQFAKGRDWHPTLLALPLVGYAAYATISDDALTEIAYKFAAFSYVILAYYALLSLPFRRLSRFSNPPTIP